MGVRKSTPASRCSLVLGVVLALTILLFALFIVRVEPWIGAAP